MLSSRCAYYATIRLGNNSFCKKGGPGTLQVDGLFQLRPSGQQEFARLLVGGIILIDGGQVMSSQRVRGTRASPSHFLF